MTSLPDEQVRRQAVTTERHAFVWASAGTGKTHTLTLRALYLLLNAPFTFSDGAAADMQMLYRGQSRRDRLRAARSIIHALVMTTFTRKAAAEMQTRLYRYLDTIATASSLTDLEGGEAAGDPLFLETVQAVLSRLETGGPASDLPLFAGVDREEPFLRLRGGARALAELAAELQISTIHSLAASLLRRHPLEGGIPPTARFIRDDEEEPLAIEEQIVAHWWQKEVLASPQAQEQLSRLLPVVSVGDIRAWLVQVYRHRWIAREIEQLAAINEEEHSALQQATLRVGEALASTTYGRMQPLGRELLRILEEIRAGRGGWLLLCRMADRHKNYLFRDGSTLTGTLARVLDRLPEDQSRFYQTWTALYIASMRAALSLELAPQWEAFLGLVSGFVSWAQGAVVRHLGLVTFDEMIHLAVRLLDKHPAVRRIEQRRLRALLVDEFQDTDPLQLKLMRLLLESDASHEILGFFVGDTKQSIYRFRGADVPSIQSFFNDYEKITGKRPAEYHLQTSFRSVETITRFTNTFFERHLKLAGSEDRLLAARGPGQVLPEWVLIDSEEEEEVRTLDRARRLAAQETLRIIRSYLEESGSTPAPYADILILVRYTLEVDYLLPVLERAGIPAVSTGAKTFFRQPVVLDTLNLLIALINPHDRLATAAVLRSPMVLMSDPDIFRLFDEIGPFAILHGQKELPGFLDEDAAARIEWLRRLARDRLLLTLSDWMRAVRAFIPVALYSEPADQEGRPLARIERTLAGFQQELEAAIRPPLEWLVEQRRRANRAGHWTAELGEDVTLADESVNAVRVMTVHKAKGLEGRFVIVYGWSSILTGHGKPRPDRDPAVSATDSRGRSVGGFLLDWGPLRVLSPRHDEARGLERAHARQEAMRLAYVAATRARDRAVLVCPYTGWVKKTVAPEIRQFVAECREMAGRNGEAIVCDGSLRFSRRAGRLEPVPAAEWPAPELALPEYSSLWEARYGDREVPGLLLRHPSDPQHRGESPVLEDTHYRSRGESGIQVGRLVHAYLERHVLDPSFEPARLEAVRAEIMPAGRRQDLERAGILLRRFFAGEVADPQGRSLIRRVREADILGRELPVYLDRDGEAWHGVIDLVLREQDVIRAVDYKTTSPQDPLPASYRQQRAVYSEALAQVFPRQAVEFEFWWMG